MTHFKLFTRGQGSLVLQRGDETVALINNSPKGWFAFRAGEADKVSSLGPIYVPVGEGVQVSRLVNQHDGAERIAEALGL